MTDEQLAGYDPEISGATPTPVLLENAVRPASSPELRTLVSLAVAAVVVATLYLAQDVLIPITLAVMLSFVLSPLVDLLRGLGVWRAAAVAISVLLALGGIGVVGTLLGGQAAALADDMPRYVETLQAKVHRVQTLTATRIAAATQLFGGGNVGAPNPSLRLPAR